MDLAQLSIASLKNIKHVFQKLEPVPEALRYGFFRASFIGPWWLRHSAVPSLNLSGLPGWQGKTFLNPHLATNILKKRDQLEQRFFMQCLDQASLIDGCLGVALNYGESAPLPWKWVVDELRVLDENTFLCMTVINLPILRALSFPFILSREL